MHAGGHGIAWDGPFNPELRRLIEQAYMQRKLIAAVDHGTAALVHPINRRPEAPDYGMPILARKQVHDLSLFMTPSNIPAAPVPGKHANVGPASSIHTRLVCMPCIIQHQTI